jgi:hypothetical protein
MTWLIAGGFFSSQGQTMSDSERKKKMISLRLSDAEFIVLKSQYQKHGARNVSDLARLALQQIMNASAAPKDHLASKLADLEDRVHALESEVSQMMVREKMLS